MDCLLYVWGVAVDIGGGICITLALIGAASDHLFAIGYIQPPARIP